MADEWIDSASWENVRSEVLARGKIDRDFQIPDEPRWQRLNDRQRAWARAWFASGGDMRVANETAGFSTPSHLTAYRFIGDETPAVDRMRTYLAALNAAFKGESVVKTTEPLVKQESVEAELISEPLNTAIEQPPVYIPEIIETRLADIDPQEQERDVKTAQKVFRSAASHTPGDFMILDRDENNFVTDWRWDLEKLKKAPAGVLKTLSRDGKGQTKVEFESAVGAAKLLADHYKPAENDGGRVDIRTMVVQVLQGGDPAERYRLDQLAKAAGERLRTEREKRQLAG